MSDKNFMALIAIIVVAVVGSIIVFSGGDENSNSGAFIGDPLQVATGIENEDGEVQRADHTKGPADAAVTLIEYSDFECPACLGFFPQLQILEANYPDDLQIVYRHNPLSSLHPNAVAASRASIAAANQDMFWEMHDLLFERQQQWAAASTGFTVSQAASAFESYAQELGLDMDRYREDVESQETFDLIDSHLDSGNQLGVTGTPTIFLNGEEITVRSAAELSLLIDEIIADGLETEGEATDESDAASDDAAEATDEETPTEE